MKKKSFLVFALVALLSLGIIVPISASNWREGLPAHHEVCEYQERICLGDGYTLYRIDLMSEMTALEYDNIMALSTRHCLDCRGTAMFIAVNNIFHTIRETPLPRTCVRVTTSVIWQCPICWRSESVTTEHAGCGTNCIVLRP